MGFSKTPTSGPDSPMKDILKIFDESFETIGKLLEESNYSGCSNIATDLITISGMSEFGDGVFIGEVLEGVFDQINTTVGNFTTSEEDIEALRGQMKEQVALVEKTYKNKDKRQLYEALRDLRVVATGFQYKCFWTMKPKKPVRYLLGRKGRELE